MESVPWRVMTLVNKDGDDWNRFSCPRAQVKTEKRKGNGVALFHIFKLNLKLDWINFRFLDEADQLVAKIINGCLKYTEMMQKTTYVRPSD